MIGMSFKLQEIIIVTHSPSKNDNRDRQTLANTISKWMTMSKPVEVERFRIAMVKRQM